MNILDVIFPKRIEKYLKAKEQGRQETISAFEKIRPSVDLYSAIDGGRISRASQSGEPFFKGLLRSSQQPNRKWKTLDLDSKTLDKIDDNDLIDLLADISPEMTKAIWDFLRFTNAGWEIRAFRPTTRRLKTIDENGQMIDNRPRYPTAERRAREITETLDDLYGSTNILVNQSILSLFLRGAFLLEGVLAEDRQTTVDVAIVDPKAIQFKAFNDPLRGQIYRLGQYQSGDFVYLDQDPTICYVPLDPNPGQPPYGRAMASAGLFACMFLLRVLHDVLRVVQQQGYVRPDITINAKEWVDRQTQALKQDPTKLKAAFKAYRSSIETAFTNLKPDQTFVHDDTVEINRALGSLDARAIGQLDSLFKVAERNAIRALKSMALFQGSVQSTSETQVKWEWHVYKRGIESIRQLVSRGWGHLFSNLLQAQGIIADVEISFVKIQTPDMLENQLEPIQPLSTEEIEDMTEIATELQGLKRKAA